MPYILEIIGGILALGIGAEMIVRSSINLANIYKISGYFIGFTIIALGTSLPELAASIQALSEVNSIEIAIGNIIGSNIANILLILGVVAIIYPLNFQKEKENNQTLMVLGITIVVLALFYLVLNNIGPNKFFIGLFLTFLFIAFLSWQYLIEKRSETQKEFEKVEYTQFQSYTILLIGLIFLYFGSKYFIIGSKDLALELEVPDSIIGLTLVAFGTSLPELATGIVAAIRRHSGIAIGTILGSNIYNIAGIFAVIVFLTKDQIFLVSPQSFLLMVNASIMTLVTVFFVIKVRLGLPLLKIKPYRLGVGSGILFLILYSIYILSNYFLK